MSQSKISLLIELEEKPPAWGTGREKAKLREVGEGGGGKISVGPREKVLVP